MLVSPCRLDYRYCKSSEGNEEKDSKSFHDRLGCGSSNGWEGRKNRQDNDRKWASVTSSSL